MRKPRHEGGDGLLGGMGVLAEHWQAIETAGPGKPLAEWALAEYQAALEAAGVAGELAAEYEARHRENLRTIGRLLR